MHISDVRACLKAQNLRAKSMNWACSSLNVTATTSNPDKKSPCELWHGRPPTLTLWPFLILGMFHIKRDRKSQGRGRAAFLLGRAQNYPTATVRMLDGELRRVVLLVT